MNLKLASVVDFSREFEFCGNEFILTFSNGDKANVSSGISVIPKTEEGLKFLSDEQNNLRVIEFANSLCIKK